MLTDADRIESVQNVTSVSNINYIDNNSTLSDEQTAKKSDQEIKKSKKKNVNGKDRYTPFASYNDSKTLNELSWQTSNQYSGVTGANKTHKIHLFTKHVEIQAQTYEKYQILKMVLKPFLVIGILIISLIVIFRIDIFFPGTSPSSDDGVDDPDSSGPI